MERPVRKGPTRTRSSTAIVIYILLVLPIAAGLAWGAWRFYTAWFDYSTSVARGMLPERIGTTGWAQTGSDVTLLMLMTGRAEVCGGAILALDAATLRDLRAQGLARISHTVEVHRGSESVKVVLRQRLA